MVELKNTVGVRSFADIQVFRHGKLTHELKDCGNDLLDGWFTLWGSASAASQPLSMNYLKLGDGNGPTNLAATTLEANKAMTSGAHGRTGTARTYSYELVNENGHDYVVYQTESVFAYPVGGWVGFLRELGVQSEGLGGTFGSTKTVQTRIVLPNEIEITSEDQLVITYRFKIKVLNEVTSETISAVYNNTPVDVVITHTPGPFTNTDRAISNIQDSSNVGYIYFSNKGVGAVNANLADTTRSANGVNTVKTYDPLTKSRIDSIVITSEKANYPEEVIEAIAYNSYAHHSKWSFNPPIPKTNRHIVKLSFVTKAERL